MSFDKKILKNILDGQDKSRSNSEKLLALVILELRKKIAKLVFKNYLNSISHGFQKSKLYL